MSVIAIVGRPNVGKSTLFNRICKRRHALVDDFPGVTRDRIYAQVGWENKSFILMDTGGFISGEVSSIERETREQVAIAVAEADGILFVADGKAGVHPEDRALVDLLRRTEKPVLYAVNKVDGAEQELHATEFHSLGIERFHPISAAHGYGIGDLLEAIAELVPDVDLPKDEGGEGEVSEIRVSIVGRPNVGKSTLLNALCGRERAIVSDMPGTTRDAIDTPLEHDGQRYLLIDTAGIRRKGRTSLKLEKLSVIKALQSIERSHVAIILVDAVEGPTDQDLHVGGYIKDRNRGCIIAVNKWDAVDKDPKRSRRFLMDIQDRFRFLAHAPVISISALTGKRVTRIIPTVKEVFDQYNKRVGTGLVNRTLQDAVERHQPPLVAGHRLKFYYATQAYTRPPTFVLFCNRPDKIHFSYERFLANHFREAFSLDKTPVRVVFRGRQKGQG